MAVYKQWAFAKDAKTQQFDYKNHALGDCRKV